MLETEQKLIGNTTYHVRQLASGEARKTLVRLTKAVGPVLGALLEDMGGPQGAKKSAVIRSVMDMDTRQLSKTLSAMSAQLQEEDLATQVETEAGKLLQLTKERMEIHFAGGHLLEMFHWLGFCLEVNYRDFFVAFMSAKPGVDAEEKAEPDTSRSASQPTSDGKSGG